jgi:hypothetical protein
MARRIIIKDNGITDTGISTPVGYESIGFNGLTFSRMDSSNTIYDIAAGTASSGQAQNLTQVLDTGATYSSTSLVGDSMTIVSQTQLQLLSFGSSGLTILSSNGQMNIESNSHPLLIQGSNITMEGYNTLSMQSDSGTFSVAANGGNLDLTANGNSINLTANGGSINLTPNGGTLNIFSNTNVNENQLTNVATGSNNLDAVNFSQLRTSGPQILGTLLQINNNGLDLNSGTVSLPYTRFYYSNITGTYQIGEVIDNGAGATATLIDINGGYMDVDSIIGTFNVNDTLTGDTSTATSNLDSFETEVPASQVVNLVGGSRFIITDVIITNPSVTPISAAGFNIYDSDLRAGNNMVLTNDPYSFNNLVGTSSYVSVLMRPNRLNITHPANLILLSEVTVGNQVYASVATPQGSSASVDMYIIGIVLQQ